MGCACASRHDTMIPMELSVMDLSALISALGTEDAEYGLSDETRELLARLRTARTRRLEEIREIFHGDAE